MSLTPRPPDFEPLASTDPVPGNTDEIAILGRRYTDTALEIQKQAANLRKLSADTIQGWTGQAAQAFQSHAADLATRISQAHARYATAGSALSMYAGPMHDAQQSAYAAVWKAKEAKQAMQGNAPAPPPLPGSPPPTAAEKAAASTRATAYDDAATNLKNATAQFQAAVTNYNDAALIAARTIRYEINQDSLKDSWWDRNYGWINDFFIVVGIVVIVLSVIAILLVCPLSAGLIADLIGTGLSSGVWWGIVSLTALQAVFDGASAATGKESWTSFVLDIASIATIGLGDGLSQFGKLPEVKGLLPRLLEPLTEDAEKAAKAVVAGRAGRAFISATGLPGFLYSLGSRSELVAKVMDWAGQGDILKGATQAASEARETTETLVKDAKSGNWAPLITMNSSAGEAWAKLATLADAAPGVVRIIVPRVLAGTTIALEGGVQWASFIGGSTYEIHSWLQGSDSAATNQTIGNFRQMLSHVPAS